MPTYEYRCPACKHEWEEIQKITDAPVKVCPSCGHSEAERLISGTSFKLKGKGWAKDGYAPKPKTD